MIGISQFSQLKLGFNLAIFVSKDSDNVILTRWFWDNNHLQPFKYKIFIKVFQCILKLKKTFLIQNYFYSNAKKYK